MNSLELNRSIYTYLHYGYLPPKKIPSFLTDIEVYPPIKPTVENTIELFQEVFAEAIENSVGNGYCVIPLSGGWDSRILLGYALEVLPTNQIKTYTFGTNGQLDFDIGKQLAKKAGVEHIEFDLSQIPVNWDSLKKSVKNSPWSYSFDSFFNKYCYEQMGSGADLILTGFMGDPLTGGHIYHENGLHIKKLFSESQSLVKLQCPEDYEYDPIKSLPELPKNTPFTTHQLLDLGVRQSYCIAPIVSYQQWNSWGTSLGAVAESETEIIAPFAHQKWVWYWLNVRQPLKKERRLYLEFMCNSFPKLADLPSKDFYGARKSNSIRLSINRKIYHAKKLMNKKYPLIFSAPKEMLNYIDFDKAFRDREDYKEVLESAIAVLNVHSVVNWLDFDLLIKEHLEYKYHHSKLFLLLTGLALNVDIIKK